MHIGVLMHAVVGKYTQTEFTGAFYLPVMDNVAVLQNVPWHS